MKLLKDGVYLKSIDRFFPWADYDSASYNYTPDHMVKLSDVNILENIKCNLSIYLEQGCAYFISIHILGLSSKKKDIITSFLETENVLNAAYGKPFAKHRRLSWFFFENASSKRKKNNVLIEHLLYDHFGFCETITIKTTGKAGGF